MSNLHKEQLAMVFKPNVLNEVSQAEVALLASWIEDILSNLDVKDNYLPDGGWMN